MIKIRLHGLPKIVDKAALAIGEKFDILSISEHVADRGASKYVRVYIDAEEPGQSTDQIKKSELATAYEKSKKENLI